jgi:hypothetical protein
MEQKTLDDLIGSVTTPVAQIEIDASVVPRFEDEAALGQVFELINTAHESQGQMQLDAINNREKALDLAYNEIVAMENLTDEQKAQLGIMVATAALEANATELREISADFAIRLEQARASGTQIVNSERERELALIYLATMAAAALKDGDEDRANQIRAQAQAMQAAGNTREGAELTSVALAEALEDAVRRRLAVEANVSKEIALRTQLQGREKALYEEAEQDMEDAMEKAKEFMGAFGSAMGEVMGDIGAAVSRVVDQQSKAITKLFADIEDVTNDYFGNFTEQFKSAMDELRDAIEQQAEEEEAFINVLADLAVKKIEDERELEQKLERERQRYFAREKARIDFLSGRRTGTIQVEEAMARGQVGEAAILQIKMQADAQQYYADQLQDNENRLMELREEARDNEISRIEQQRDLELELIDIRRNSALEQVDTTETGVLTEADVAQVKAKEIVDQANVDIDKLIEKEGFLRENFLRDWNRITPATEAEYKEHLGRLESFMDESDARMAAGVNEIKNRMGEDLQVISGQFGTTVDELMGDLNLAIDGSDFAVQDFTTKLLATTSQTLMAVLQAFEGFNTGLQSGYANGLALSQAFMEIFQRDIDETVAWANSLAKLMIAEEEKWKQAGEQLAEAWGSGFKAEMNRILSEVKADFAEVRSNALTTQADVKAMLGIEQTQSVNPWAQSPFDRLMSAPRYGPTAGSAAPTPPRTFQPTSTRNFEGTAFDPSFTGDALIPRAIRSVLNYVHQFPERRAFNQETQQMQFEALSPVDRARMQMSQNPYSSEHTTEYMMAMIAAGRGSERVSMRGGSITPQQYLRGRGIEYHTGGLVGGLKGSEVPAILEKGEYVIQKSAVSAAGVDFLNSLNSSSAMFSVPKMANLNIDSSGSQSSVSSTNTYNLSFKVDGGNIDEQKLAQKVVFEIKKMERAGGGGRRV